MTHHRFIQKKKNDPPQTFAINMVRSLPRVLYLTPISFPLTAAIFHKTDTSILYHDSFVRTSQSSDTKLKGHFCPHNDHSFKTFFHFLCHKYIFSTFGVGQLLLIILILVGFSGMYCRVDVVVHQERACHLLVANMVVLRLWSLTQHNS